MEGKMTFKQALKNSVVNGFTESSITTPQILMTLFITFVIALYIFFVYRMITKSEFYSKDFNISVAIISVITAGIILAMSSNLVISLGMVGALSIVRFRTAIKEPLDLLFLFWSIGTGIICGAGLFKIGIVLAVCVTLALVFLRYLPEHKSSKVLFITSEDKKAEEKLNEIIKANAKYFKVKSRNITKLGIDIVYEIISSDDAALIDSVSSVESVTSTSLISHDGEFR